MARNYKLHSQTGTGRSARNKFVPRAFVLGAAFFLSSCISAPKPEPKTAAPAGEYSAKLLLSRVPDGGMDIVNVEFTEPFKGEVKGKFEDTSFEFYPLDSSSSGASQFQGIFGVPHGHHPAPSEIRVEPDGMKATSLPFKIVDADYPSETLKVDSRKVHPPKREMPRILSELKEIGRIYHVETLKRYWSGPFTHPINSRITDLYGINRLYNGEHRSYHGGMDFKAAMGTPIHAAGAGRVLLAKNLYFSGGTVILDHGYGLLTMYFHMSKILVKKGELVSDRQLLGLSGKSGRVTGPHLHFQVVVHQVKVNPMGLFEEIK